MPNLKLFIDQDVISQRQDALQKILPDLQALLCRDLNVGPGACQIAVISVLGMENQPPVNIELQLLPKAGRSAETLTALAQRLRALVAASAGAQVAVRISMLDPATYIALK